MQQTRPWKAGPYVLNEGRRFRHHGCDYEAGDTVTLDRPTAERLGPCGSILHPDSDEAKALSATTDEERRRLRADRLEEEARRLREESDGEPLAGPDPDSMA